METKPIFKIPQHPYDGDTFAVFIINENGQTTADSSYVLYNYQDEGKNTKILYHNKLWNPNDLIPLTFSGHSNRIKAPIERIEHKTIMVKEQEEYQEITYETVLVEREFDEEYEDTETVVVHHPEREIIDTKDKNLRIYLMMDDSGSMDYNRRIDGLNAGIQAFWSSMESQFGQNLGNIYISMFQMGGMKGWTVRDKKMSEFGGCPVFTAIGGYGLETAVIAMTDKINQDLAKPIDQNNLFIKPIAVYITDATDLVSDAVFNAWDLVKPKCAKVLASGIDMEYPSYITRLASSIDDTLFVLGGYAPQYNNFFNRITSEAIGSFNETIIIPAWDETVTRTVTKTRKVTREVEETIEVPITKYRTVEKPKVIDIVVYDEEGDVQDVCSIRTIQYFTYVKMIDTWICYWQNNICQGYVQPPEEPNTCTITVNIIVVYGQWTLLPLEILSFPPWDSGSDYPLTLGTVTYTANQGSRFNRIYYWELIDAVGFSGFKQPISINTYDICI